MLTEILEHTQQIAVRILHQELAVAAVGIAGTIPGFLDRTEQGNARVTEAGQDRIDRRDLDLQIDACSSGRS